ncbi:MAG: amino acid permease [Alphaproteobacteria bacterium]|nr:amino acid permease [Alphaproteobacteria bacterium]
MAFRQKPDAPAPRKKKRDPMDWKTWQHAALVAVLAWAGVGADGLSSANYGPEEAFKAMAGHEPLVLWLALITAVTVIVISMAYVQIIALFPSGGGGYQAATRLVHPYAGLISGSALVVDYSLTIAISVAAAADALLSLAPPDWVWLKPWLLTAGIAILLGLNLRGIRESIMILAPVFFGFLLTHVFLIGAGLIARSTHLIEGVARAEHVAARVTHDGGAWALIAILGAAYAAGAGTYTGIEALSNNAHALKPPRAQTGARAMALIAISLAVVAGGIMLLYTVWLPQMEAGKTLNAVVFQATLAELFPGAPAFNHVMMIAAMSFAAALLLVAANAGFLGGPAVLASMALDKWAPHGFAHLSSRLVAQNGLLAMGVAASLVLLATGGRLDALVVLYSINVFLTFSLSLTGLVRHNLKHRTGKGWAGRMAVSLLALVTAVLILITLFVAKFFEGAWVALALTVMLAGCGYWVRDHYLRFDAAMDKTFEELLVRPAESGVQTPKPSVMKRPVAIVTGSHGGAGLHALMHAQRLFRGGFDSVVIISAGEVDAEAYGGHEALERLKQHVGERCAKIVAWSRDHGMPAKVYTGFSTDAVETLEELCLKAREDHPNLVFVATRAMTRPHGWASTLLHGGTALSLQRRLHAHDAPLIVLPMRVDLGPDRLFRAPEPAMEDRSG